MEDQATEQPPEKVAATEPAVTSAGNEPVDPASLVQPFKRRGRPPKVLLPDSTEAEMKAGENANQFMEVLNLPAQTILEMEAGRAALEKLKPKTTNEG